eukprot:gene16268-22447_t
MSGLKLKLKLPPRKSQLSSAPTTPAVPALSSPSVQLPSEGTPAVNCGSLNGKKRKWDGDGGNGAGPAIGGQDSPAPVARHGEDGSGPKPSSAWGTTGGGDGTMLPPPRKITLTFKGGAFKKKDATPKPVADPAPVDIPPVWNDASLVGVGAGQKEQRRAEKERDKAARAQMKAQEKVPSPCSSHASSVAFVHVALQASLTSPPLINLQDEKNRARNEKMVEAKQQKEAKQRELDDSNFVKTLKLKIVTGGSFGSKAGIKAEAKTEGSAAAASVARPHHHPLAPSARSAPRSLGGDLLPAGGDMLKTETGDMSDDDPSFSWVDEPEVIRPKRDPSLISISGAGMGTGIGVPVLPKIPRGPVDKNKPVAKDHLEKILDKIQKKDMKEIFKEPAPGYSKIITNPMDFRTMRRKMLLGEYSNWTQLEHDLELMFDNCQKFNAQGSIYAMEADKLRVVSRKLIALGCQGVVNFRGRCGNWRTAVIVKQQQEQIEAELRRERLRASGGEDALAELVAEEANMAKEAAKKAAAAKAALEGGVSTRGASLAGASGNNSVGSGLGDLGHSAGLYMHLHHGGHVRGHRGVRGRPVVSRVRAARPGRRHGPSSGQLRRPLAFDAEAAAALASAGTDENARNSYHPRALGLAAGSWGALTGGASGEGVAFAAGRPLLRCLIPHPELLQEAYVTSVARFVAGCGESVRQAVMEHLVPCVPIESTRPKPPPPLPTPTLVRPSASPSPGLTNPARTPTPPPSTPGLHVIGTGSTAAAFVGTPFVVPDATVSSGAAPGAGTGAAPPPPHSYAAHVGPTTGAQPAHSSYATPQPAAAGEFKQQHFLNLAAPPPQPSASLFSTPQPAKGTPGVLTPVTMQPVKSAALTHATMQPVNPPLMLGVAQTPVVGGQQQYHVGGQVQPAVLSSGAQPQALSSGVQYPSHASNHSTSLQQPSEPPPELPPATP